MEAIIFFSFFLLKGKLYYPIDSYIKTIRPGLCIKGQGGGGTRGEERRGEGGRGGMWGHGDRLPLLHTFRSTAVTRARVWGGLRVGLGRKRW